MVEIKKTTLAGILVTLIILSSGATYHLEKTGKYMNCKSGWILQEDGAYDCEVRGLNKWCAEVSPLNDNNMHYRCYLGKIVYTEIPAERHKAKQWSCNNAGCIEK